MRSLALAAIVTCLISCGAAEDEKKLSSASDEESPNSIADQALLVDRTAELPQCTATTSRLLVYVKTENRYTMCVNSVWSRMLVIPEPAGKCRYEQDAGWTDCTPEQYDAEMAKQRAEIEARNAANEEKRLAELAAKKAVDEAKAAAELAETTADRAEAARISNVLDKVHIGESLMTMVPEARTILVELGVESEHVFFTDETWTITVNFKVRHTSESAHKVIRFMSPGSTLSAGRVY